jgi:hypothetical protein
LRSLHAVEPPSIDRSQELRPALVLAILAFLIFGLLMAGLITETFGLDDEAAAWVGAGLVGLGSATFAGWAVVLHLDVELPRAERLGGDLLLAGLGVLLVVAGLPTFAAGVI